MHQAGFFLKSADGRCFDGSTFKNCAAEETTKLLWGVGIKYVWGKAQRYFFNFHYTGRDNCIVASGKTVKKGSCKDKGALEWGLRDGELSIKNGQMCLARLLDNTAVMARCAEAAEHITIDVPNSYTDDDLAEMIKNQDKLTPEERNVLAQLLKQKTG
jgi:hypothetical protein